MKTIKTILIAATLICASVVSTMSAQQAAQPAQEHQWKVAIGDSVMIKRECQKYLTGETPSVWVWDKVHTVRQLGTKRFPEGVLLMNIYSWICEDCLVVVNGRSQEEAAQAAAEQAEDKESFQKSKDQAAAEQAKAEEAKKEEAKQDDAAAAVVPVVIPGQEEAKAEEQKEEEAKAEESKAEESKAEEVTKEETPEEKAQAEEAKTEETKAEEAKEEAAQEEQTVPGAISREQAKGDSIHSKQDFKGKYDRFTIGLRGGAASLMHHADKAKWTCGGDVVLDLQYAHYWTKDGRPVDLGLIVGLGIGYSQSSLKAASDTTAFPEGGVNYTVVASDIKETDHQLQLEVPLMFSLIADNGVFFNIGPKFMMPVYAPYKQTVNQENTHITAYFPETGITIQDNPVTGQYTGQQPEEANGIQFNVNVMLTAEIGYEWILKSGNSLGLGAYANYSVYNTFSNTVSTKGLFDLTAPNDNSKAVLNVLSATKTYADKVGYFDAGLKIAYHFNFPKQLQMKRQRDAQLEFRKNKKSGTPEE